MTDFHHSYNGGHVQAAYTFSDIRVNVGRARLSGDTKCHDVYEPLNECDIHLEAEVCGIRRVDGLSPDSVQRPVTVRLMRMPQYTAVHEEEFVPQNDYDDFTVRTDWQAGRLKPGRYQLTLMNIVPEDGTSSIMECDGNSSVCTFRILPDGSRMAHPATGSVRVERSGISLLRLNVGLRTAAGHDDVFDAYCHDASMTLMGHCTVRQDVGRKRSRLPLDIMTCYAITEGHYTCVITHNAEPFLMVRFSIDADGATHGVTCEKVTPGSMEHIMIRHLDNSLRLGPLWARLRRMEGCGSIIRQAVEYRRLELHNNMRRSFDIAPLTRTMSHVFTGVPSAHTIQVLTDFARLLAMYNEFTATTVEELTAERNSMEPNDILQDTFSGRNKTVCITDSEGLLWGKGRNVAHTMERAMSKEPTLAVFLVGSEGTVKRLREAFPKLMDMIPECNRIPLRTLNLNDMVHGIQRLLSERDMTLSDSAAAALSRGLSQGLRDGRLLVNSADFCTMFVDRAIMPRYTARMLRTTEAPSATARHSLSTIMPCDIDWEAMECPEGSLNECLSELNALVGLSDVKRSVEELALQVRFNSIRRRRGLSAAPTGSHHLIFTGNPGTGKTTVAKMIGRIYHSLGILSKGDVVVAERGTLVGRYIGETEQKMQQVLEQARGNVLFIDEAYTLCDSTDDRKDYGYRVIECLLTVMAEDNPDMTVIMAGYGREMDRMLQANQGLRGRFAHCLHFADYSAEELMQIARGIIADNGLTVTDEAAAYMVQTIERATASRRRDFSNARWIRQYTEGGIIPKMAARIISLPCPTDRDITTITLSDVEHAYNGVVKETPHAMPRIGFTA